MAHESLPCVISRPEISHQCYCAGGDERLQARLREGEIKTIAEISDANYET